MNFNTILILLGILFSCILVLGNMTQSYTAIVLVGQGPAWQLSLISIIVGIVFGYGIHAKLTEGSKTEEEHFDF